MNERTQLKGEEDSHGAIDDAVLSGNSHVLCFGGTSELGGIHVCRPNRRGVGRARSSPNLRTNSTDFTDEEGERVKKIKILWTSYMYGSPLIRIFNYSDFNLKA